MALLDDNIHKISNTATIVFGGKEIKSNTVDTNLKLKNPTFLKVVDKLEASSLTVLTYTITITNPNVVAITNIPFNDPYDDILATYLPSSFTVDGVATAPLTITPVTYVIASLGSLATTILEFKVTVI